MAIDREASLAAAIEKTLAALDAHVRTSKGFEEESWINPLRPVDSVAAYATAKSLLEAGAVECLVSVAPEGHVYGFFFEQLGSPTLSVHVDYPPTACEVLDDLEQIRGKRVLILEDDVATGTTLRLVLERLRAFAPRAIDLYLGRPKDGQSLEFIDPIVENVYLAEDVLNPDRRQDYEDDFMVRFGECPD